MDKYVAFIPVRGGSKSIPLKNIREICGRPLVYWTLDAAVGCSKIEKVYLCTDSLAIREKVVAYIEENQCAEKLICIGRPPETATDTASTESAMLYFAQNWSGFEHIILIQATSPLLTEEDLSQAISKYEHEGYDSLLSVVRQKRFFWQVTGECYTPINYDFTHRPRRQEFDGYLVENGAFYINTRENLLQDACRLSGKVGVYEMAEETYFEIDEPSDWLIIEQMLSRRQGGNQGRQEGLKGIKLLLTDCDGVLTDGGMYYSESGEESKRFSTLDGMAVALLHNAGIKFGIMTGENVRLVRRRAEKMGADFCLLGVQDKLEALLKLCTEQGVALEEVAYIGDDVNDLDVLKLVGFPCCVPGGLLQVRQAARYITQCPGGQGAVREVAELILSAQREE